MKTKLACLIAFATAGLGACAEPSPDELPTDGGRNDSTPVDTGVVDPDTGLPDVPPACSPGDLEKKPCGMCGTHIRTCNAASAWNPFGACEDEIAGADCAIGAAKSDPCPMCGTIKSTCDPTTCMWQEGACTGSGVCEPGDIDKTTASCTVLGEIRERVCDSKCGWGPWSACKIPTGWVAITGAVPSGFSGRKWATGVWSGTNAYIWGGYAYASPFTYSKVDGAVFNLTGGGSWSLMPAAPTTFTTAGRYLHTAVFDGKDMIVWGGIESTSSVKNTGARFDTIAGAWGAMSTVGAPSARAGHAAVWATTSSGYREMIVLGGCTSPGSYGASCSAYAADGASYNPATNTWTPIPAPPTSTGFVGRWKHQMVWSGSEVVIWSGQTSSGYAKDGIRYDPIAKTWTTFATPSIDGRIEGTGQWTGKELLVWGGTSPAKDDGARYLPGGGWSPITAPTVAALTSTKRFGFAAWYGANFLFVFSGLSAASTPVPDGAIYDPTLDSWTPMNPLDALSPRAYATTVWTGKEALVFGGTNSNSSFASTWYADAKIYRP